MQHKIFVIVVCALLIVSSATVQVSADDKCTTGSGNCVTCDDDKQNCVQCENTFCVGQDGTCIGTKLENCKTCKSATTTCDLCDDGFYFDGTKCTKCTDTNCKTCTKDACSACNDNYHYDDNSKKCVANTCTDTNCVTCDTTKNPGECTKCKDGFYLDNNACTACSKAITGCATCEIPAKLTAPDVKCDTCTAGFYLDGTTCKACSTAITGCATCEIASELNSPTVKCDLCADGFYLFSENNTCGACSSAIANCTECTNAKECTKCADKFKLENGKCVSSGGNDVAAYSVTYFVTFALLLMTAAIVAQFA